MINAIEYRIRLDVSKADHQSEIVVKQNDTRTRVVRAYLSNGSKAYEIVDGVSAVVRGKKPSGAILYNACEIDGNFVVFELTNQMIAEAGRVECEITLTGIDGEVLTSPSFLVFVEEKIYSDNEIESTDEYTQLQKHEAAENRREQAEAERIAAEDERIVAESARVEAEIIREQAEILREQAEVVREQEESDRIASEEIRKGNELARVAAEESREAAENEREAAEASRESAEEAREAAEIKRDDKWNNATATATATAAGSPASVSVTITDGDVVFDFGIPRGLTGPAGVRGEQGVPGIRGETGAPGPRGATFTPSVSDGYLSWSNDGGLTNPPAAYIRGPQGIQGVKGDTGSGFAVLGYYATASALSSAVTSPKAGDAYGVGTAEPYDIYIWDGVNSAWVNNGPLQGAKGDPGPAGKDGVDGSPGPAGSDGKNGVTFTPTVSSDGTLSWSNDGGKENPSAVNLRGPAGKDGVDGSPGAAGSDGKNGVTFTPTVSSDGTLSWSNDGGKQNPSAVNIRGPRGETGATGDTGPTGPAGYTPVKYTDYFTAADKAEMVNAVIAALPVYGGEVNEL